MFRSFLVVQEFRSADIVCSLVSFVLSFSLLHLFIRLGAVQFRDVCRLLSLGEAGERPLFYKKYPSQRQ